MTLHSFLLTSHSLLRWLLVICLVAALIRSIMGFVSKSRYVETDRKLAFFTTTLAHLQLLIGLVLYFISPIVAGFLQDMGASMKIKEVRFFGMEHMLLMVIAIALLTVGGIKAKRAIGDTAKHKAIVIWFGIATLILWVGIPWALSPMSPLRPWFRM